MRKRLFLTTIYLSIVVSLVLTVNQQESDGLDIPEVMVFGEDALMSLPPVDTHDGPIEIDVEKSRFSYSENYDTGLLVISGLLVGTTEGIQGEIGTADLTSLLAPSYYEYLVEDREASESADASSMHGLFGWITIVPGYEIDFLLSFSEDLSQWAFFAQLASSIPDGWINTSISKPFEGLLLVNLIGYPFPFTIETAMQSGISTDFDSLIGFNLGFENQLSARLGPFTISETTEAYLLREIGLTQNNWIGAAMQSISLDLHLDGIIPFADWLSPSVQAAITLSGGAQSVGPTLARFAADITLVPGTDLGISLLFNDSTVSLYPEMGIRFAVHDKAVAKALLSSFLHMPEDGSAVFSRSTESNFKPQRGYRAQVSYEYEYSLSQNIVFALEYLDGELYRSVAENIVLADYTLLTFAFKMDWNLFTWIHIVVALNPYIRISADSGLSIDELAGTLKAECRFDFKNTSQSVIMKVEWSELPLLGLSGSFTGAPEVLSGGRMCLKTVWKGENYPGVDAGIEVLLTRHFGFRDMRYFFSLGVKELWE